MSPKKRKEKKAKLQSPSIIIGSSLFVKAQKLTLWDADPSYIPSIFHDLHRPTASLFNELGTTLKNKMFSQVAPLNHEKVQRDYMSAKIGKLFHVFYGICYPHMLKNEQKHSINQKSQPLGRQSDTCLTKWRPLALCVGHCACAITFPSQVFFAYRWVILTASRSGWMSCNVLYGFEEMSAGKMYGQIFQPRSVQAVIHRQNLDVIWEGHGFRQIK